MNQGVFVTGTDTDVGKTVVSTILAVGLGSFYWKPIQTGARLGTDSDFVRKWIGRDRTLPESYAFPEPLSPHLAAGDVDEIDLDKCKAEFRTHPRPIVIEGAGGVFVPLNSRYKIIDLILAFELPTILVASTKLGTINHSLLSLEALAARRLPIAGVISTGDENRATQKSIEYYGGSPVLGHVSFCPRFSLNWFQDCFKLLDFHRLDTGGPHVRTS